MSTNLMQRIADLEAQVAALTAENNTLRVRSNGNGHFDSEKMAEAIGARIERSGQLLREDFTGKLAGLISPYVESTLRRCAEIEGRQGNLEKRFEEHRKVVANSAAEMSNAFVLMRQEMAKDWNAQREQIQNDFSHVDAFVKWYTAELQKNGRGSAEAVASCNRAVTACRDLTEKMSTPVTQTLEHLDDIRSWGEGVITSAAGHLTDTYKKLRRPVLKRVTILLVATIVIHLFFGSVVLWRNRAVLDTNWQALTEHSEQQKQEMRGLLDKAMEEAKESQIDREIKVKMWDALVKSLTAQQRVSLIDKFRGQVNGAERSRLDAQMESGYDQMYGRKK